jgi:hypothetical protein
MARKATVKQLQRELQKLEKKVASLQKKREAALALAAKLDGDISKLLGGAMAEAAPAVGRKPGPKPGRKPGRKPGPKPGRKAGRKPGPKPGRKPGRKPGPKPGRKPGRPKKAVAKRGPGRPPGKKKPGRPAKKRGPGRPKKAAGKRGPGRPKKAAAKPSGMTFQEAAVDIVSKKGSVAIDTLAKNLTKMGFNYKNIKQVLLMQMKKMGLKKNAAGQVTK